MKVRAGLTAALLVFLLPVCALASQAARVIAVSAEIHQFPNASSPLLATLAKDAKIRMSSDVVKDVRGEYWYKTRSPSGELGYVRATDVKGEQIEKELRTAGVSAIHGEVAEADPGALPWTFVMRVMGLAGYSTGPGGLVGGLEGGGGEGEFSISAFPTAHGYLHRMLSLGAAVQYFSYQETAVLGSLIYRFFSDSRIEPEARFRIGDGLTSGKLLVGGNFGLRYPFSLDSGVLFCGYLEMGALLATSVVAPSHFFLSAGLGFHF